MHKLHFMTPESEPEMVRCRVYDGSSQSEAAVEAQRVAFVTALEQAGVVDCPAYDPWVEALQARGWLPAEPDLEPNPDGPGRIGRWRLTEFGRLEWSKIKP